MNSEFHDELISAYLDGELSSAEAARVEAKLEQDAGLRQMMEELRTLRATLRALPRHELEADFSESVLRRAEREILSSGVSPRSSRSEKPAQSVARRRFSARTLFWTIGTLAAAITLVVHYGGFPGFGPRAQIAQAPLERAQEDEDRRVELAEAIGPVPVVAKNAKLARGKEASDSSGRGVSQNEQDIESNALPFSAASKQFDGAGQRRPKDLAAKSVRGSAGRNQPASGDQAEQALQSPSFAGNRALDEGTSRIDELLGLAQSPLFIVTCDPTPEALISGAFENVLAANEILLEDRYARARRGAAATTLRRKKSALAAAPSKEKRETLARLSAIETIYVEATPSQIRATVAAMSRRQDEFGAVSLAQVYAPAGWGKMDGVQAQDNLVREREGGKAKKGQAPADQPHPPSETTDSVRRQNKFGKGSKAGEALPKLKQQVADSEPKDEAKKAPLPKADDAKSEKPRPEQDDQPKEEAKSAAPGNTQKKLNLDSSGKNVAPSPSEPRKPAAKKHDDPKSAPTPVRLAGPQLKKKTADARPQGRAKRILQTAPDDNRYFYRNGLIEEDATKAPAKDQGGVVPPLDPGMFKQRSAPTERIRVVFLLRTAIPANLAGDRAKPKVSADAPSAVERKSPKK